MTNRSIKSNGTRSGTFTISLILGLLLIPLSAVAAAAVISNDGDSGADAVEPVVVVAEVPDTTVTTTLPDPVETVIVTEAPTFTREDLETACGDQGWELVEQEVEGTISELEQAALDSLRQICADEGLDLPGPPAPPAVIRTVSVVDPSDSATTTTVTSATMADDSGSSVGYDDDHDDEDEDGHDDDGHDDDGHDDDGHDDDGHGEDDD